MADTDRLLEELLRSAEQTQRTLNYMAKTIGGGDKSGAAPHLDYKKMGLFGKSIGRATESITLMHGSAETAAHQFSGFAAKLEGGAAFATIITVATDLGKQFNKMSDIGQTFGGSMFDMAAQAGKSGLSLEQFTQMLGRNSTASAVLQSKQTGTASAMGQLQWAVRSSLKPLGFYGMSLNQLTDLTSDYTESLRLSGQLDKLDSDQQSKAVVRLSGDVTAFGAATGKSREAILKGINDAYRETSAAMRTASRPLSEAQTEAYGSFVAFFSSLPGVAGEQLPKFFSQLYGTGGNAFFTEFGKTFISAGLPQINTAMGAMVQSMKGGAFNVAATAHATIGMRDTIMDNQEALQNMANAGNQSAAQALAFAQSMLGLDEAALVKKISLAKEEAKTQKSIEKYTRDVMLFESNFHLLSGKFREGLYESFSTMTKAFDMDQDPGKKTMTNLQNALNRLGRAFGTILGTVFSKDNMDFLATQLEGLSLWLEHVVDSDSLKKLEEAIIGTVEVIGFLVKGLHSLLELLPGVSSGFATILEVGLVVFRKSIWNAISKIFGFKGKMSMTAGVVEINTGRVVGGGAAGAGLGGGDIGGVGPAGEVLPKNAKSKWGARFKKVGGHIAGFATGIIASYLGNAVLDALLPDGAVKSLIEVALDVGLTATLTKLGPKLAGAILGPIVTRIGGGIVANMTTAAAATAAEAAATGVAAGAAGITAGTAAIAALSLAFIGAMVGAVYKGITGNIKATGQIDKFVEDHGFKSTSGGFAKAMGYGKGDFKNDEGEKIGYDQLQQVFKSILDASPKRDFATAPINDIDLSNRLEMVRAQIATDQQAVAAGDNSKQNEIASLKETMETIARLLHKGNQEREDQGRRRPSDALH